MKLNAVARTVSQLQVDALPEGHPLIAQLNQMYGDHIYFLDTNGRRAWEVGVVVNLANWTDSNPPKLEVHEPELTNSTVALGAARQSPLIPA